MLVGICAKYENKLSNANVTVRTLQDMQYLAVFIVKWQPNEMV